MEVNYNQAHTILKGDKTVSAISRLANIFMHTFSVTDWKGSLYSELVKSLDKNGDTIKC